MTFNEQQTHDLALIWTKSEWERKVKKYPENYLDEVDESVSKGELFEIYKDAFSYFRGMFN